MTTHVHEFTALWFHWGPSKPQDVHVHRCFDGFCSAVKIGDGRSCDPKTEHRLTDPYPADPTRED